MDIAKMIQSWASDNDMFGQAGDLGHEHTAPVSAVDGPTASRQ